MHLQPTLLITCNNCNQSLQEIIMAQLGQLLTVQGFEEQPNTLLVYLPQHENEPETVELIMNEVHPNYTMEVLAPQNYNALWESNFEPVIVENFCGIRANFHTPITNVLHEIIITPKMSFGTGHHATTYQVISAMQSLQFNNKLVCDFGTGTGVLAILASKLGAANIHAIDNEEWSIANAQENILVNNCTNITLQLTETIPANTYDIILANINKNVLIANMQHLYTNCAAKGIIILSGVLLTDKDDMLTALTQHGFDVTNITEKNNWLCITANKQQIET